ncbi:hypothetical protein [Planococcus sp. 4-30]|uniref:hypothetical protein n=1 Tax=Planococcus sp. 4-30 TaxID=2874583 RepID=UPI001CC1AE53|nr:hypothetical protein [Planococcus sp. 4-30]
MKYLKLQAESLQLSIYCEIVLNTLSDHKELSLIKTAVYAYLIKKYKLNSHRVYDGRHTSDTVYKSLSLLSGDFEGYCDSIEFIIKSIDILNNENLIFIEDNILKINPEVENTKKITGDNIFLNRAIRESKKLTDKQFLKEVLASV